MREEDVVQIPVDVVTNIVFEFLPLSSIAKLRLVSHFFKTLVDRNYWLCGRAFRIDLRKDFHNQQALGRLFADAAIKHCIFDGFDSLQEDLIPLKDMTIYSKIECFRVMNSNPFYNGVCYEKLPIWMLGRLYTFEGRLSDGFVMCASTALPHLSELSLRVSEFWWWVDFAYLRYYTTSNLRECCIDHTCLLSEYPELPFQLSFFSCMQKLKNLTLINRNGYTQALDFGSSEFQALEYLTLSGNYTIPFIPVIETLQTLKLASAYGITSIPTLPNLKTLFLNGCCDLVSVENLPRLETLEIGYCACLAHVKNLPSVTHVKFIECCRQLVTFSGMPNILVLEILQHQQEQIIHRHHQEQPKDIVIRLSEMPLLSKLNIEYLYKYELVCWDALCPNLSLVSMKNNIILSRPPNFIACIPNAKTLILDNCWIFPDELKTLKNLKQLALLHCGERLQQLPVLAHLKELIVDGCKFVTKIPVMPELERLRIIGLPNIFYLPSHMPKLIFLEIKNCEKLMSISKHLLRNLKVLAIICCLDESVVDVVDRRRIFLTWFHYDCLVHCQKLQKLHLHDHHMIDGFEKWSIPMKDTLECLELRGGSSRLLTIERFEKLEYLSLVDTTVERVCDMPKLKSLNFHTKNNTTAHELLLTCLPRFESYCVTVEDAVSGRKKIFYEHGLFNKGDVIGEEGIKYIFNS